MRLSALIIEAAEMIQKHGDIEIFVGEEKKDIEIDLVGFKYTGDTCQYALVKS